MTLKKRVKIFSDLDVLFDLDRIIWFDEPLDQTKYKDLDAKSLYDIIFRACDSNFKMNEDITDNEIPTCTECGAPLIPVPKPSIQSEGVGPTYAQEHLRSFSVECDIVCKICGLVYGVITKRYDQY